MEGYKINRILNDMFVVVFDEKGNIKHRFPKKLNLTDEQISREIIKNEIPKQTD